MENSTVNSQILDSVNNALAVVIGQSAAQSFALLDTVMSETIGMAMQNWVSAQQNSQIMSNAALATTCARVLATVSAPPTKAGPSPSSPPTPSSPAPNGSSFDQDLKSAENAVNQLIHDMGGSKENYSKAKNKLNELVNKIEQAEQAREN